MGNPKEQVEALAKEVDALTRQRQSLRQERELAAHRGTAKALAKEVDRLETLLADVSGLQEYVASHKPVAIEPRVKTGSREATGVLLLSDLHPEESVTPEKVSGLNEFSPAIASKRIDALILGIRWYLRTIREHEKNAGYKCYDFVLALLGDLISNTIHPDLAESVQMGPADALIFTYELIERVIEALLADNEIERLIVPCCMGNHDRMTPKIRHQTKAETSLATIVYAFLAKQYRNNDRVHFDIARGNMTYTRIYGRMVRWTHGDDIRYNGGVGGLTIPMRKAIDSWNRSIDAELTCCGHWHEVTDHRDFVVNGSLIGYTAFSQAIKARFEPAAQAAFVLDKERGKRLFTPLQVQDCERWS